MRDAMDTEEMRKEIEGIFEPEIDDDNGLLLREFPHTRLQKVHKLDLSYMHTIDWEGSSIHRYTRLCPTDEQQLHTLTRNSDMPFRLFEAALRLFADSIITYHERVERKGNIRYYPSVILTFWSAFETF